MDFDSEAYRRAMMYWRMLSSSTMVNLMTPRRRQECWDLYYYWRDAAIERETEEEIKFRRNRAHVRVLLSGQGNSTDDFILALLGL